MTEKIELVHTELLKLIDIACAEDCCINFDLHQDNDKPADFMFYESWDSRDLWQTNMSVSHLAAYMEATDGAVEGFTLNEMTIIGLASPHPKEARHESYRIHRKRSD